MYYQTFKKKFCLPRASLGSVISQIVLREAQKQELDLAAASRKKLEQLHKIGLAIEKNGIPENLVCQKLPKGLGYGIFLHPKAKPIRKDELIGAYSGKAFIAPQNVANHSTYTFAPIVDMILTKNEQKLFDPDRSYRPNRLYSLDIDAEKEGNFIRFINHSKKPNLVAHLFRIPKNSFGLPPSPIEVLYLSKKTIHPGEQLLVNYEGEDDSYWCNLGIRPLPITPQTFMLSDDLKIITS